MANFMENFFGRKKETNIIEQEPSFDELCNALQDEEDRSEFRELAKEFGSEEGSRTNRIEGSFDDLTPEQRKFNDLLNMANKEYYGVGGEQ